MKRFKDLETGDTVYKITINQTNRKPEFQKLQVRSCSIEGEFRFLTFSNPSDMIRVTGGTTRKDGVVRDSFDYNNITRTILLASLEELDKFLKDEVEQSRVYQQCLERIYNEAWDKPVENQKFKKGDLIYVPDFSSPGLYDGEKKVYFFDGEPLDISGIENLRMATYDEEDEFFETLKLRMSFSAVGLVKEKLILAVRKCGWEYKRSINDFARII